MSGIGRQKQSSIGSVHGGTGRLSKQVIRSKKYQNLTANHHFEKTGSSKYICLPSGCAIMSQVPAQLDDTTSCAPFPVQDYARLFSGP